ncbi:unnamed protein product [Prunus armeniaca]|uniref:Uncharacterized protein n=1 Tax=Prunus armeniaca TaxID=36596 RepID=A0A6J5TXC0_PRUAR|nr:unnamed protein product [Prunus armeniaca]
MKQGKKEKQRAKERDAKAVGDEIVSALRTLAEQTAKAEEIIGRDMSKWINNDKKRWMRGTWLGIRQT